ncbi:MAG: glucokinase [Pseudomonadales bacterium]|nr:glucokinase [Pseudomonadales bacterium]
MTEPALLAVDVGGTRARFGLFDADGVCLRREELATGAFADGGALLQAGIDALRAPPVPLSVAAAGPREADGVVRLTNRAALRLDVRALTAQLGRPVQLWNDFVALAAGLTDPAEAEPGAAPELLGGTLPAPAGPRLVCGPGTGLGTALLREDGSVLAAEGGHAGLAASTLLELELLRLLTARFGRVSRERVLSGPGLVALAAAFAELEGGPPTGDTAPAIVAAARSGDAGARRVLDGFLGWLGATLGDLVLDTGARGGVLLAGGVAARLAPELLAESGRTHLRTRFEDKGPLASWLAPVPLWLVRDEDAGLRGAARLGLAACAPPG